MWVTSAVRRQTWRGRIKGQDLVQFFKGLQMADTPILLEEARAAVPRSAQSFLYLPKKDFKIQYCVSNDRRLTRAPRRNAC